MPRILVIDSDPGVRAMLVHALEALAEVEQAATGVDALRLLATRKYALVILELHVRPIDGFVILRTLGARPGPNKETPIYVLTSDHSEHARLKAMSEHALFVLTKPVSIATVVTLVDAGLKKPGAAGPPTAGPPTAGASGSPHSRPPPPPDLAESPAPGNVTGGNRLTSPRPPPPSVPPPKPSG